jgi:hypothetical protein
VAELDRLTLERQSGNSKRHQPHRPQVSAIAQHQPSDQRMWPPLIFLPLVRIEGITEPGSSMASTKSASAMMAAYPEQHQSPGT